jgi:hypothetical protein
MRISLKIFLFVALAAFATPTFAQIHLGINFGPPRARHEERGVSPISGGIWIGGYYGYNDSRRDYDWHPGRWEAPPSEHHVWVAPRYRRHGDHYDYYEGNWKDKGKHDNGRGNGKDKGDKHGNGRGE